MLDDRVKHHRKCDLVQKSHGRMPIRVLQLDTEQPRARLINPSGLHEPFVALSCCWGGKSEFVLTSSSEKLFRQGIPFDQIPHTLQDALVVTQRLNFRYLWIDAVCIFQDSREDWVRESARMREIYKSATLTIDAATASKPSDGLFCKRSAPGFRCRIQWRDREIGVSYVYLRPANEYSDTLVRDSHTTKRAWTLQEALLASHFGTEQISFDCTEGRVDEAGRHTGAVENYSSKAALQQLYNEKRTWRRVTKCARFLGLPTVVWIPRLIFVNVWYPFRDPAPRYILLKRYTKLVFQPTVLTTGGHHMTYYDQWREIVQWYTSRSLTKKSDVLPALSGLAEEFHQITGKDKYIAGMWEGDLINSLSWSRIVAPDRSYALGVASEGYVPREYLAPAWTWASLSSGTCMALIFRSCDTKKQMRYLVRSKVKILGINIETEQGRPFGKVLSGCLRLEGPILNIQSPLEVDAPVPRLPSTHAHLIEKLGVNNFRDEFAQQHRAHEGQKFSVLYLSSSMVDRDEFRYNSYLLLETASKSACRRVGIFDTRRTGEAQKRIYLKRGQAPQSEDQVIVDIQLELDNAPWKSQVISII